ncbi:hypothetical protein PsYK624_145120 [Phanerochaete sordida]|uniref:DUF6533 domain-containing protein n=1 Tax=Phanerochaete sordida TaxID=48140 RepID=A0A9P3GNK7_9APHY|nr:hypothetical protein PsYK624_145120 [Phanerochaete sordida]
MSADGSLAEVIAGLNAEFVANCEGYALAALCMHEFIINLDLEVITAWQRKKTATSILLISVRWTLFLNSILLFTPATTHKG